MKKTVLFSLAAAAAFGFAACNNLSSTTTASEGKAKGGDMEELYSGILPAADAQGTLCTIKLEFDDDNNYTDGEFVMVENSLVTDTVAAAGLSEAATSYSEGKFRKESKSVNGANVEYLVLTPDAKDNLGAASNTPTYLVVNADQTLVLVNSDIEMPADPALYTLKLKK